MKLENLISNTAFGIYLRSIPLDAFEYCDLRFSYDNFMSQKLEIWQFVPCKLVDGIWVVLEEPDCNLDIRMVEMQEYQQAKDAIIFEGFEIIEMSKNFKIVKNKEKDCQVFANQVGNIWYLCNAFSTIEDLVKYNLKLTATAQKQL